MSGVRISVALASYNGGRFIREQMDSVLQNLSPCDEVVVSDDGSIDDTLSILSEYRGGEIPVTVVKGPGQGIKQNIGNALRFCKGRYIFLADQDDVWTSGKVKAVMNVLGKDGCMLVCHDAKVMNASLSAVLEESFFAFRGSKPGFLNNLLKNRYMGCCMAFDRRLLSLALPIPERVEMHDQWIGMLSDLTGGKSRFLSERLLLYRRHDANVSDFGHGTLAQMAARRARLLFSLFQRLLCRKF